MVTYKKDTWKLVKSLKTSGYDSICCDISRKLGFRMQSVDSPASLQLVRRSLAARVPRQNVWGPKQEIEEQRGKARGFRREEFMGILFVNM